ncbi:MAG: polyprenyl synthetase family protein [Spirochaetales bacterium]|nr:polyprenyl synthetase family protein [Spirochaetales bacterium]
MNNFWKASPEVSEGLTRVQKRLRTELERLPTALKAPLRRLIDNPGKGLRPGLVFLAAASGEPRSSVDDLAAAAELLHLASLIHDDIVDSAGLRRGQKALHRQVGVPSALLYGDLMFAACFRLVSTEVSRPSASALAAIVTLMAGSELLQQQDLYRPHLSLRHVLRKTMGKTAALMSLCLYSGAVESGQDAPVCQIYRRVGYALGMAFQIRDDLLDFTSQERLLGKPVFNDLRHGVYSVPVVLALRREYQTGRNSLMRLLSSPAVNRPAVAHRAVALITAAGALTEAEQLVTLYTQRALHNLGALPIDPHRQVLHDLCQTLADRPR